MLAVFDVFDECRLHVMPLVMSFSLPSYFLSVRSYVVLSVCAEAPAVPFRTTDKIHYISEKFTF
jgi:hypothetical protein